MPSAKTPWIPIAVVAFALFVDYAVYGLVLPLTPLSPAGITSDAQLSILAGGYGVGLFLATPFFGIYGDRIGFRWPMVLDSKPSTKRSKRRTIPSTA
jgi:MFS family permease